MVLVTLNNYSLFLIASLKVVFIYKFYKYKKLFVKKKLL